MKSPFNPKILVWTLEGKPAPKAKVFFFNKGTDVPKSVKYVEGGTLTNEITADSSGDFPQVELLEGEYTLKAFIPIDPKEAYPLFPEDYEYRDSWDLSGEPQEGTEPYPLPDSVSDLNALRNYDGDANRVWVNNRLFIKEEYVSQTDNNGTIILSSVQEGVVWRMDLTGYEYTSVEWFGADRTGSTDATAAILSAISAIGNNGNYSAEYRLPSVIYIPNGIYKVTSNISMTYPVLMDKNVKFMNTSDTNRVMMFYSWLDTDKTDVWCITDGGLKEITPRFLRELPNGKKQYVNLGWFPNAEVDIEYFQLPTSFVGQGTINCSYNGFRISSFEMTGDSVFNVASGVTLNVDSITYKGDSNAKIKINGDGHVAFGTLPTSILKNIADVNKCQGDTLIINISWNLAFDVEVYFRTIRGSNSSIRVYNNSGTPHYFYNVSGIVMWETFIPSVHDIVWKNKSNPSDVDWTNADSDDWNNYLVYGSNDFIGTSTSGDITLTSDSTLKNLNHTGTMQAFGLSLVLDSCTINLTSGKEVRATALTINDSNILTDNPANGKITSPNMRLRDSFIQCAVEMANGENLQMEMRGCRFTNQVSVEQSRTLQTLVAKNNEVALCNFIPYTIYCYGLSNVAKVSIDVSENWTTDTTGQLVHSKGFAKTKPHWNAEQHFYFQPYEAIGILDIRNKSVENSPSLAANSRIHAYFISGGDSDYTPLVNNYTSYAGALLLNGVSSLNERRNITFDAWNTQAYEE